MMDKLRKCRCPSVHKARGVFSIETVVGLPVRGELFLRALDKVRAPLSNININQTLRA